MSLKNFLQGKLIKTGTSEFFGIVLDVGKDNFTLTILKPRGNVQSKILLEFIIRDYEYKKGSYLEIKLLGYDFPFIIYPHR